MNHFHDFEFRDNHVKIEGSLALIGTLAIIIYAVALAEPSRLAVLEFILLLALALVRVSPFWAVKRIALVIPFGGVLALFQLFIRPGTIIAQLGPLTVSQEGLDIGILLFMRVLVALTAVALLNSITTLPSLLDGARRLRVPAVLVDMLGLTVRYIPMFLNLIHEVTLAQKLRGFSAWDRRLPYRWRLNQLGWAAGSIFLSSLRQGQRTYLAMLCRGLHHDGKKLPASSAFGKAGWVYITAVFCTIIAVHLFGL